MLNLFDLDKKGYAFLKSLSWKETFNKHNKPSKRK